MSVDDFFWLGYKFSDQEPRVLTVIVLSESRQVNEVINVILFEYNG